MEVPQMISKKRYCFIAILFFVLGSLFSNTGYIHRKCQCMQVPSELKHTTERLSAHQLLKEFKEMFKVLVKNIYEANKHVRGLKTSDKLRESLRDIKKMLNMLNVSYEHVTSRTIGLSKSVCSEKFMGTRYGYPNYETGWVLENCSYAKPLTTLISVILTVKNNDKNHKDLTHSLLKTHPSLKIYIHGYLNENDQNQNVKYFKILGTEGHVLNTLSAMVQTPYVLMARDMIWFNEDARLDRLIRQIERLGLSAAGGAYRDISGHWFVGCQQSALRNYTLVYESGYDESVEECQFCDNIDGPFVIKTEILQKFKFNEKITQEGLFEDFFLRLQRKTELVICPDSMFYTNGKERTSAASEWTSFATTWQLSKIIFSGNVVNIPCSFPVKCYAMKGSSLHPCCQKSLAGLTNKLLNVCNELNITCRIFSGTSLGSVKMSAILPWDLDADIAVLHTDIHKLLEFVSTLKERGYVIDVRPNRKSLVVKTNRIYVEMFSYNIRRIVDETNMLPTRTNIDGNWLINFRNPGKYLRNRFGYEIYQHAQSWIVTGGENSWSIYKTNTFMKCDSREWHACLDTYNGDGIRQFRDPIP